jgi:UDP-GlcNAc:undecaprenyl-phosphate/decaprenyl-phosphate GlcNAc-1-phosphate transferase
MAIVRPGLLLCATAAVSAILCRLLIHFSGLLPFIKEPAKGRWHRTPVPDSGGLAIFAAVSLACLFTPSDPPRAVVAGATILWLLGVVDDRVNLRAGPKLVIQLVVTNLVVTSGVCFDVSPWYPLNFLLTVTWLIGITNAVNLIDNMDGLAAGSAIIIAVFRAILLIAHGHSDEALLCGVLAAACAGFLIFNLQPARIFMGDGGSMFLGFTLAALTVTSALPNKRSILVGLYPPLTFAYPIFDTLLVSLLRRISRRPICAGGCDHSSHRLASLGWSDRTVVFILWLFTALGGLLGLLLNNAPFTGALLAILFALLVGLFGLALANMPYRPAKTVVSLRPDQRQVLHPTPGRT